MILSNVKLDEIIIPTLLQFGKGDIAVANATSPSHVLVVFQNQEPREIGDFGDIKNGEYISDTHPEVVMLFDNENSIDVVVKKLLLAKEDLHKILTK